ncbi:MAG: hypothetical protein R3253_13165 [Longimicrobiales bacterium]|nr:hypothetical protein [Longimicrobiales bacterium]
MKIGPLYHWSPKRFRDQILKEGLRVRMPCRLGAVDPETGEGLEISFPWLCFACSPSAAWALIMEPELESVDAGGQGWDLWEARPVGSSDRSAEFRVRGDLTVMEVRIHNSVPPDRIWWVGEREVWPHDTMAPTG